MSIKVSGRNRFDRTHIINLAESISLYILSLNQSDEWNDRRMSGSLDSTLFPRKQWNGFYMAGLLTYSCCGRLPGIFFPVALSRLLATYLWNLQQRDCSGFTPDSLLIAFFRIRRGCEPMHGKDRKKIQNNKNNVVICQCVNMPMCQLPCGVAAQPIGTLAY